MLLLFAKIFCIDDVVLTYLLRFGLIVCGIPTIIQARMLLYSSNKLLNLVKSPRNFRWCEHFYIYENIYCTISSNVVTFTQIHGTKMALFRDIIHHSSIGCIKNKLKNHSVANKTSNRNKHETTLRHSTFVILANGNVKMRCSKQ